MGFETIAGRSQNTVEITSLEISVVGVAGGRDATGAFRRRAKEGEDENTENMPPSSVLGCA
jgi:hypothetical protein